MQTLDLKNTKIWFGEDQEAGKKVFARLKELGVDRNNYWKSWDDVESGLVKGYYITNSADLNLSRTWDKDAFDSVENYREVTLEELNTSTKPDGYLVPCDMFEGKVLKGTVYITCGVLGAYCPANNRDLFLLPKEIVETWEPYFKPKEVILIIGSSRGANQFVTVGKNEIKVAGELVAISDIKALVDYYTGKYLINNWKVSIESPVFTIGCTKGVTLESLKTIINTYEKLNS